MPTAQALESRRRLPALRERLLSRRKLVTIAAGFRCRDGVVLCADTEESSIGFKRKVAKIEFKPDLWPVSTDDPIAIFTGSGDSSFVDEAIDRMWAAAKKSGENELEKLVSVMIRENREYHREIWSLYPPLCYTEHLPDADLLFAVWAKDAFGLFSVASTTFKPITTFATIGCGGDLAHYLCADAHRPGAATESCIALAAHMLEQVKTNIPGCGGESYIAVLTGTGAASLLEGRDVEDMTEHLADGEHILKQTLLASADLSKTDKEFGYSLSIWSKALMDSRKGLRRAKEKRREQIDHLIKAITRGEGGTPTPSVHQR
jgi:hypothetical protein